MRSGANASMRAARCDAGPDTSIFSTSWPPAASAPAIESTVSTVSNSASSSASVSFRLCVNAIFMLAPLAHGRGDDDNTGARALAAHFRRRPSVLHGQAEARPELVLGPVFK